MTKTPIVEEPDEANWTEADSNPIAFDLVRTLISNTNVFGNFKMGSIWNNKIIQDAFPWCAAFAALSVIEGNFVGRFFFPLLFIITVRSESGLHVSEVHMRLLLRWSCGLVSIPDEDVPSVWVHFIGWTCCRRDGLSEDVRLRTNKKKIVVRKRRCSLEMFWIV